MLVSNYLDNKTIVVSLLNEYACSTIIIWDYGKASRQELKIALSRDGAT